MTLDAPLQSWEYQLLAWAQEPLQSLASHRQVETDDRLLDAAYRYCEDLTRFHSRTFFLASGLLPLQKRRATRALYAFCRITDNLVDDCPPGVNPLDLLTAWRSQIADPHASAYNPVALAWADARSRFHIPPGYAEQLIDGVARDVKQKRYATFSDLAEYSYGVASTVGLMAMHIIGFRTEDAVPYAVKLGVALQMTNILRDVAEDWRAGRVYLPQDELAQFGLTDADVGSGINDERWQAFMRFQIDRNRQLYADSRPGIAMLSADGRFAIAAAAELYRAILDTIEARQMNVFAGRSSVSSWGKIRRLPQIWWQSRTPSVE